MNNPLSYQLSVLIEPNWPQMVRWYFPELKQKTDKEAREFMGKFIKKFKIDRDTSLYNKYPGFSFVEFRDGVSGLNPIWSDHWHRFISDLEIKGFFLIDEKGEFELTPKGGTGITISPNYIRAQDGETISAMPFDDIVNLFVQIQKETRCAYFQIKKFPKEFQAAFDKESVSYEPDFHIYTRVHDLNKVSLESGSKWFKESGIELFQQTVEAHAFKTPYYSVKFNFRFFSPDDMRPNISDLSTLFS